MRPAAGGPFEFITYKEFDDLVTRTRVMLKEAGIGKGDKVRWVGGWVGGWVEESEAVRTRCYMLGLGGWVGG